MENSKVEVVMVPYPSQSHLNQLLHLAAAVSFCGIPVHYVASAVHIRQVRLRAAASLNPDATAGIEFHGFSAADPSPDQDTLAIIPFKQLRCPLADLVGELSVRAARTVVVYDRFVADFVGDAVSIPNVESYAFFCYSAFNSLRCLLEVAGNPFAAEEEEEGGIRLPSVRGIYPEGFFKFLSTKFEHFERREGDIYNTSRSIEGKYVDLLRREEIGGAGKRHFAIWPVSQENFGGKIERRHECLLWLDGKAPRSVVYVSFGSSVSMKEEEIGALAAALERSGRNFVWVVREADRADIFAGEGRRTELPEGFEERVRERGIVVREWAPQTEILSHRSTGAFMTHCGWNSCFESLVAGVPVAAWPMHTDQWLNAVFLTEVLRAGVVVREWAAREEAVGEAVIKSAVERLLSEEEGAAIRTRAEELSAAVKKSMEGGGELNSFTAILLDKSLINKVIICM